MSWFESLNKDMFQALVREAIKDEFTHFRDEMRRELHVIDSRLTKLEERVERMHENQLAFASKVDHLEGTVEGTVEGTLRGLMTELKYDLYERLRNELPGLVAGAQTNKPAKKKTLATSSHR